MASITSQVAALAMAGMTLLTSALNAAAPHNNPSGSLFLVNREWGISESFVPELASTRDIQDIKNGVPQMQPAALQSLVEMAAACKTETKADLVCVSSYRSYDRQEKVYASILAKTKSRVRTDRHAAWPGTSEHQLGLSIDLGLRSGRGLSLGIAFGSTRGGKWVRENAHRFGFILRYDLGWEDITGYRYEPWHFRYVGMEAAAMIHSNPQPLETFLLKYREATLLKLLKGVP